MNVAVKCVFMMQVEPLVNADKLFCFLFLFVDDLIYNFSLLFFDYFIACSSCFFSYVLDLFFLLIICF